jgi:glutamate synthase domain-containing protein 1
MCGVIGLLIRDQALDERGPDSSGIAVYADDPPGDMDEAGRIKVSLGSDEPVDWGRLAASLEDSLGETARPLPFGGGLVLEVPPDGESALHSVLAAEWANVRVLATGLNLRVLKDTGRPSDTCARFGVAGWEGYLAVAHTRMATESAVTVLHSHPFVPTRDLCVVHNGSFSNYATVRRFLLAAGVRFDSDNDSEVAARYLARRLEQGDDLEEATRWVMKEMDGFFTLVISTASELSVVRDAFACKPAVVAETDGYVAVASEFRALAELPGIATATVFEPGPEEVYTWSR